MLLFLGMSPSSLYNPRPPSSVPISNYGHTTLEIMRALQSRLLTMTNVCRVHTSSSLMLEPGQLRLLDTPKKLKQVR